VRVSLAGLPFEVEPDAALNHAERELLGGIGGPPKPGPPFRLSLVEGPLAPQDDRPSGAAAEVSCDGGEVRVRHRHFSADLEPFAQRGRLLRPDGFGYPLEIALRVALCSSLPLAGALPLHAAGIVVGAQGVAFFGPSGAGKSTLAALAPHLVLSDEMVVVHGPSFALRASGFWGTLRSGSKTAAAFSLAALVELDKGPDLALTPLAPRDAMRRLIDATLVPPAPALWTSALGVLAGLVRSVPAYRMAWAPKPEAWEAIGSGELGRILGVAPPGRRRGSAL
jgi:hypothetical protein